MQRFAGIAREQVPTEQRNFKGAVNMSISAHFKRPLTHLKRHGKGVRASAPEDYTNKPDADNISKFIGDALTGICYHDDAQICDLSVKKRWTCGPDKVEVELKYR